MPAKKTSISIDERLYHDAQQRFAAHYCANFSEYVTHLIKLDMMKQSAQPEEQEGIAMVAERAPKPVSYKTPSRKRAS